MRLLVVDLLAERKGFGKGGVREIVHHFSPDEVFLWSPHTDERLDYGFGAVVHQPVEADAIVITGSRRNVSMWEPWMDDVVHLIRTANVPLYGICFGHQIIAHAFGGCVVRTSQRANYVAEVKSQNGGKVYASFAHQEQVVDGGELEVVASADHCPIAACRHPSRPIFTVQYHPEVVADVLDISFSCGEMSEEERAAYDDQRLTTDVGIAFGLSSH
jgi:GMP synthase-like glutamine amidotransferase